MRNYSTQMEAARKGIITPELEIVAKKERMTTEELLPLVASGKVAICANKNHKCIDPEGVGSMLRTKIMADTAGHEVARFSQAWHNGLPLAAALLAVNEAVCRVYVLVPGQLHTGGCLVNQRPDFCGNLHHTVSSSFTL